MAAKVSRLKRAVENLPVCRASRFEASVLKIKLTVGKAGRGENQDTPNKSLDVRAKQCVCYRRRLFTLSLRMAASSHVISTVRWISCMIN